MPWERARATHRVYTFFALAKEAKEDSSGKVYSSSQSRRVVVPNRPVLGYCGAWIWVSEGGKGRGS